MFLMPSLDSPNTLPLLRTDSSELQEELEWASNRPESRWSTQKVITGDSELLLSPEVPEVFEHCLTTWEYGAYVKYQGEYGPSIYSLNQNPDERPTFAKDEVPYESLLIVIVVSLLTIFLDCATSHAIIYNCQLFVTTIVSDLV